MQKLGRRAFWAAVVVFFALSFLEVGSEVSREALEVLMLTMFIVGVILLLVSIGTPKEKGIWVTIVSKSETVIEADLHWDGRVIPIVAVAGNTENMSEVTLRARGQKLPETSLTSAMIHFFRLVFAELECNRADYDDFLEKLMACARAHPEIVFSRFNVQRFPRPAAPPEE